jgi:hypothetical protein
MKFGHPGHEQDHGVVADAQKMSEEAGLSLAIRINKFLQIRVQKAENELKAIREMNDFYEVKLKAERVANHNHCVATSEYERILAINAGLIEKLKAGGVEIYTFSAPVHKVKNRAPWWRFWRTV